MSGHAGLLQSISSNDFLRGDRGHGHEVVIDDPCHHDTYGHRSTKEIGSPRLCGKGFDEAEDDLDLDLQTTAVVSSNGEGRLQATFSG